MAISSIIKTTCPTCGKIAVEKKRINFGQNKLVTLECGHVVAESALKTTNSYDSIVSSDGRALMKYQVTGIQFAEQCNAKCLIADEQGLGKTVQVCGLLKLHREDLTPCVIVTKTSIKLQFNWEVVRWCGVNGFLCQNIQSGKERAMPVFDVYIISYDLLKVEGMFDLVPDIKLVIIDECQAVKNHTSGRAKAVQNLVKDKNIDHIIGLSGTPIKNNAGEYFTILNLLRPGKFPHYQRFIDDYCDSYNNGWSTKVGGLRDPEYFKSVTEDFIIRRTKAEVLPDLPELSRQFHHVELDKKLNKAYAEGLKELDDLFYDDEMSGFERGSRTIEVMTKLRQITGISKVDDCVEYVTDFLLSCNRKIVVFAHHHTVVGLLEAKINSFLRDGGYEPVLNLNSQLSGDDRQKMVVKFRDSEGCRVMIASTLAAGEGLNLQFCSDAIMLERQWNPANEEQAEGRFHRFGQKNPVSVVYMIASETIDEYFTELVESKRAIVASALDGKEYQWDQNSLMQELAEILVTKGKKKWSL